MAKTADGRLSENSRLRQTISDMVNNIETVMSNIHIVLGDMGVLVRQIDSITARLETRYERRRGKNDILLDANRNQCDIVDTPGMSNPSKLPSPFIDYTYLGLTDDCEMCGQNVANITNITYNEKYPLWIQCDNWQTGNSGNSPSDLSIVSAGSDFSDAMHSGGSDGCCSQSWKNISNFGSLPKDDKDRFRRNRKESSSDFKSRLLTKYSECCKAGTVSSDAYCGVYEEIMEAQLDDISPVCHDGGEFELQDSFSDDLTSDGSSDSNVAFSMSDEHVVHFSKVSNTWTAFKIVDVTVREFSDSSTSL